MKKPLLMLLIPAIVGILALAQSAEAQRCEESVTGSVCEDKDKSCSPPNGGTCRQVTNNAGNPAGCVCSALSSNLYIVSEEPQPRSPVATFLSYIVGAVIGLVLGFVVFKRREGKEPHAEG